MLTLTFHGAARTVTGSCHELATSSHRVLIDCGLFQGSRSLEALNFEPFAFSPASVDAVILTHAHLDHSGLLGKLVAEGFRGPIWCTRGTADLLAEMLPDAARIQEQDAMRRNRRPDRADEPPIRPLYTAEDVDRALEQLRTVELDESFEAAPGFAARLWNAGHILGSASVEFVVAGVRTFFSGDVGPQHKAFYPDPDGPAGIDHLLCESTYGDREREEQTLEERRALLETEVLSALHKGGNLVVPVFALERTQELLLDLGCLLQQSRIGHARVFIDSPLASRTTEVFRRHSGELQDMDCAALFSHPAFHFVESVESSMGLNNVSGAIILSASGMCEAGRIRHHLRHNLPRPDSTILFVGFQARGTLGRTIVDGARRVRISGKDIAVRAAVRRIDSYSAHADRSELLAWAEARSPVQGTVFLVHGEAEGTESLQRELGNRFTSVLVPEIGEKYELRQGLPARRLATGRAELRHVLDRDWQNDYADFAVNLKRELRDIETGERRAEAIARMRRVLDDYRDHQKRRRVRS